MRKTLEDFYLDDRHELQGLKCDPVDLVEQAYNLSTTKGLRLKDQKFKVSWATETLRPAQGKLGETVSK